MLTIDQMSTISSQHRLTNHYEKFYQNFDTKKQKVKIQTGISNCPNILIELESRLKKGKCDCKYQISHAVNHFEFEYGSNWGEQYKATEKKPSS